METNIEEISQAKRRINVEIDAAEVDEKLDNAYRELSKGAKVKGFRPGKVPRRILEQRFGGQVADEVKNSLIKESFSEVMSKADFFPLGTPSIEDGVLKRGENFTYTINMEIRPEFELEDYQGLPVEKEKFNISEQDVDKKLEEIRQSRATLASVQEDRAVKENDFVSIEYEGFLEGRPLKDLKGQDLLVEVGSNRFYPEIEKGLIGLKTGDTKDIAVDLPEDSKEKGPAGERVNFNVSIRDIKKKQVPDLNEDFAKNLGQDFKSLSDLRDKVKQELTLQEEKRIDGELKDRILKKIAGTVDFELPRSLVDEEVERSIYNLKQQYARAGSDFNAAGLSEGKLRQDFRESAEEKVKEQIVLGKIADQEKIKVEEADIREKFQDLADQTGTNPASIREYYEKNNLMDLFTNQLLVEKVLNHLVQVAKIEEVEKITN